MLRSNTLRLGLLFLIVALSTIPACDTLVTENNETILFDSTTGNDCLSGCHSDDNNLVIVPRGQWASSAHASPEFIEASVTLNGEDYNTSSSDATCAAAACHSNEGYINKVLLGSAGTITTTSPIGCYTCHFPHTGDYNEWRIDTLRGQTDTVELDIDSSTYVMGKSNMCANCHRAAKPAPTGTDPVTLTGSWGPHFSPQAEVFGGTGGARFGVVTDTISHNTLEIQRQNGCISCHYGFKVTGNDTTGIGAGYSFGEHTFRLEDADGNEYHETCNANGSCHAGAPITAFYTSTIIQTIKTLAKEIRDTLEIRNILDTTDPSGLSFVSGDTLSVHDAQVLYNYLLYHGDGSQGVHNPLLMLPLMQETVNQLSSLVPIAKFELADDIDSLACTNTAITFTDLSTGTVDSIEWDFGVGANPTYTFGDVMYPYDTTGTFSVSMTAHGPGGADTYTLSNLVKVESPPVALEFEVNIDTGWCSLDVQFTDTSEFASGWLWDFGDGNSSILQNPNHTYDTVGTYSVSMIVHGFCGDPDTLIKADFIRVFADTLPPVAAFVVDTLEGDTTYVFNFTNNSTNSSSWLWNFGDGSSDSTATTFDATHRFRPTIPTVFTVSLIANNGCSSDTTTIDITITIP